VKALAFSPDSRSPVQRTISLKRRSVWLTAVFCVVFAGSVALSIATAVNVQEVASRAGTDAAPEMMDRLHGVGNAEKLIAFGDQLVSADRRDLWLQAGIAMQALIYHPTLRDQFPDPAVLESCYRAVAEIMVIRDEAESLGGAMVGSPQTDRQIALSARIADIWTKERTGLALAADIAAAAMVARTTADADEISRLARLITFTTAFGAVVGLGGSALLLAFARTHLLRPLLAVADYLSAQRKGLGDTVELPSPGSEEMANVFEAAEELSKTQEALREMAFRDRLTGLANRYALEIQLDQALATARRNEKLLAVLFVDLDRFKSINDLLGHSIGDGLISVIAQRLVACVRESDMVARLGGDEFVIVLTDVPEPRSAAAVAEKLLARIAEPAQVENHYLECSASVGICIYPEDGADRTTLMKNADIAMYSAKSARRGGYRYFDAALDSVVSERLQLEADLARAIKEEEFILHYQPIIDSLTGRVAAVEALLRWRRGEHDLVPPDKFIPILEETGLIAEVGAWVLRTACRTLRKWRDAGLNEVRLCVNISPRQFRTAHFRQEVAEALHLAGLPPEALELEMTESLAMEDPQGVIAILKSLKEMGVSLAIDDFGTGYSSLSYLKLFPIDRLKIDRSFVRELETDSSDAAICIVTIDLARRLKLEVVAEGVETLSQFHYLRRLGCQYVQGYHFSRPLPADEARAYVALRAGGFAEHAESATPA
jgi:diguanylate cyclase